MKSASIYLKDGVIRIIPHAKTTEGLTKNVGPVFFLQETDPSTVIGQKTLEALALFGKVIPHPKNQEEWKASESEWCQAMKIKSWRTFAKNAKVLGIEMDGDSISIIPTRNMLPKRGFEWLQHKSRTSTADPEELGRVIIEAFDDCE